MKICEMMGTGSSSASKGMRNDAKNRELIKQRQKKRNDIDDISHALNLMSQMFPEHYSKEFA